MAFSEKVKIVYAYVPDKVKIFIEKNLIDEIKYFQKKYSLKIEVLSEQKLIIPEYKIQLHNKSKKLLNTFENINTIFPVKKLKNQNNQQNKRKTEKKEKKEKKISKKKKTKKVLRTLWTRRKKSN